MTVMTRIEEIYEKGELFDGRYRLLKPLSAAGGSADVWLAADVNTIVEDDGIDKATKVAIKVYRPKNMIDVEGEFQFRNEFRKVFGCHHENIIQPTYFSVFEEMPYLVLPYCPAGSAERLVGRLTDNEELWKFIYEVASGLAYLHAHSPQIIHQDIKPANVLVDGNGSYAITDFGISAEMGGAGAGDDESGGTWAYMAPERFAEDPLPRPESDVWAFGATLFEMITGNVPFGDDGGSRQEKDRAVPAIEADVPQPVRQLVNACLSFDPAQRPTAREIADMVLKKRYARSRKVVAVAVAAVLVAVTLFAAFFMLRLAPTADDHLDSMCLRGDSVLGREVVALTGDGYVPSAADIDELEKALVIYNNVSREASPAYARKDTIARKVAVIKELMAEIRDFDRARDLAEKAKMTDMEEEYVAHSILQQNHKTRINELTQKLK